MSLDDSDQELSESLKQVLRDQIETEDYIRNICRPYTDVEGDSYRVPPIEECVEEAIKTIRRQTAKEVLQKITGEEIRGVLARGYCHRGNTHKDMDADLIEAMALEVEDSITKLLKEYEG